MTQRTIAALLVALLLVGGCSLFKSGGDKRWGGGPHKWFYLATLEDTAQAFGWSKHDVAGIKLSVQHVAGQHKGSYGEWYRTNLNGQRNAGAVVVTHSRGNYTIITAVNPGGDIQANHPHRNKVKHECVHILSHYFYNDNLADHRQKMMVGGDGKPRRIASTIGYSW